MIKTIAIDDEPLALELIRSFCKKFTFIQYELGFTNTAVALEYLGKNPVDLLFLDVNMPAISGLEFYKTLTNKPMLIFTTSYSEYAVDSYELNAIDYLLKPFSFARFEKAIFRVKEKYNLVHHAVVNETEKFLMLKMDYSMVKVILSKILFIEALDNYLKIHLDGQAPVIVRMTLKSLMEKLNETEFVRVHRSYIVSLKRIEFMRNKAVLIAGELIPVGQNYEEALKIALVRYS
jgi:DNA-binding LytR/AlgR family response regulator